MKADFVISHVTLLDGKTVELKDRAAREAIEKKTKMTGVGEPGGIAPLDDDGKVPMEHINTTSAINAESVLDTIPTTEAVANFLEDKIRQATSTFKVNGDCLVIK